MPENILVVNMNYLGDALLTTPALAALRYEFPDARIDTLAGRGAASVLDGNPDLNTVIVRQAERGVGRLTELYRILRRGRFTRDRYTMVVILPPIPAYAAAAWLARTPRRVGQATRQMTPFLTDTRPVTASHFADRMRETMPGTLRPAERRLHIAVSPDAEADAQYLLSEMSAGNAPKPVAVNMGATRPQKRWQPASFAALLDLLPGVPCVLVGAGADDESLAAEVLTLTRRTDVLNLVGQTSVKSLAAVLAKCGALVSADSGPMHLATAVGTPTVALFGSTDPNLTGPYDDHSVTLYAALACAPCFKHPTCGGRWDCMRALTPDAAALSVRGLLRAPAVALPTHGSKG